MTKLIRPLALLILAILFLLIWYVQSLQSAPAPLPRRHPQPDPCLEGWWELEFNGTLYSIYLIDTTPHHLKEPHSYGGVYYAWRQGHVADVSEPEWVGHWSWIKWDKMIGIYEKPKGYKGAYTGSFPAYPSGRPLTYQSGEQQGLGPDWGWDYPKGTIKMWRVK